MGPRPAELLSDPENGTRTAAPARGAGRQKLLRRQATRGVWRRLPDQLRRPLAAPARVIQPLLTPRAVQAYVPDVKAATDQLIAAWRAAARAGETMDAQSWVSALARDLTVRALFGAEAGGRDGAMTTREPAAWRPKYRALFALLREDEWIHRIRGILGHVCCFVRSVSFRGDVSMPLWRAVRRPSTRPLRGLLRMTSKSLK
jgi:hypothetical protein